MTPADRVKPIGLLGRHINVQASRERTGLGVEIPPRVLFDRIKGKAIKQAPPTVEHRPPEQPENSAAS